MTGAAAVDPLPAQSAERAGLRYVQDDGPGIRRVRSGRGFRCLDSKGRAIRDEATLRRIRALAIPPAWTAVWICPDPSGHLQASGRDARGRKQYRYHARWRQTRDETKFDRMVEFARALPRIRARSERDMARPGLAREKVLATVIGLLERTLIRVGNDEYARTNASYGLTTLRDGHVKIRGGKARFTFRGKGGIRHAVDLQDRRISRIVKACRDLPGYELFQYVDDDGKRCRVDSADVNAYIREVAGEEFTAKDFRTWAGTVHAATELASQERAPTATRAKREIAAAVDRVAGRLGNTRSVCRKSYIHPAVIEAYEDGSIRLRVRSRTAAPRGLSHEEVFALRLLERARRAHHRTRAPDALEKSLAASVRQVRRRGRASTVPRKTGQGSRTGRQRPAARR